MTSDVVTVNNHFKRDQIVFSFLIVLALVGVVVTDVSPSVAHGYWVFTLILYACTVIFFGRKSASSEGRLKGFVAKQFMNWTGSIVAILCVYTQVHTGSITFEEAGAFMLIILALATFIAGSHAGWRFYMLGTFLALASVIMAYVEEFMWVIFIIAGLIIAGSYFLTKHK